jgi:hypothetical protein
MISPFCFAHAHLQLLPAHLAVLAECTVEATVQKADQVVGHGVEIRHQTYHGLLSNVNNIAPKVAPASIEAVCDHDCLYELASVAIGVVGFTGEGKLVRRHLATNTKAEAPSGIGSIGARAELPPFRPNS